MADPTPLRCIEVERVSGGSVAVRLRPDDARRLVLGQVVRLLGADGQAVGEGVVGYVAGVLGAVRVDDVRPCGAEGGG